MHVYVLVSWTVWILNEDLNMIAMTGTSDQPCWLAEACIFFIFFLLPLPLVMSLVRHQVTSGVDVL